MHDVAAPKFEVQVRRFRAAGGAYFADDLAMADGIAFAHAVGAEMAVLRFDTFCERDGV